MVIACGVIGAFGILLLALCAGFVLHDMEEIDTDREDRSDL